MPRNRVKSEAAKARARSASAKKAARTRAANKLLKAAEEAAKNAGRGRHRAGIERDIARIAKPPNEALADGVLAEACRGIADALDVGDMKAGERSTLVNTLRRAMTQLEQAAAAVPKKTGDLLDDD